MDEMKKSKIKNGLFAASMVLLGLTFAYIIYTAVKGRELGIVYDIVIIVALALFWVLTDVLPITLTEGFEGKTEEQKKAYKIYALIDGVGIAGLAYFGIEVGGNGMTGVIIYAVAIMLKRKYFDEYKGIHQEEGETSSEAEKTAEIADAQTDFDENKKNEEA